MTMNVDYADIARNRVSHDWGSSAVRSVCGWFSTTILGVKMANSGYILLDRRRPAVLDGTYYLLHLIPVAPSSWSRFTFHQRPTGTLLQYTTPFLPHPSTLSVSLLKGTLWLYAAPASYELYSPQMFSRY